MQPTGSMTERLNFELCHASLLNRDLHYDAVSYTWDGQIPEIEATCDGQRFLITKNCSDIMRHLRLKNEPRPIWIDQICIDQLSNVDISYNVCRMGEIFTKARNVIIWTGEIDRDTLDMLLRTAGSHVKLADCHPRLLKDSEYSSSDGKQDDKDDISTGEYSEDAEDTTITDEEETNSMYSERSGDRKSFCCRL